jgi:hypothetical protein
MVNQGGRVGRHQAVASVLLATQIAACSSWRGENVPTAQLLQDPGSVSGPRDPGGQ